jgi:hypothetical protein
MSNSHNKRRADIRARLSRAEGAYARCAVLECNAPTMAHQRNGLNRHYCRRHVEHYRRHGSYSKASYTATEINSYRRTAYAWLQAHRELPAVVEAVDRVRTLYWRGGRPVEAFRLAGRPPQERAKVVWARLHEHKVDPLQVLAVWLAVAMRHGDDVQPEHRVEFRRVQAAKVLHRLAGGSHKRWEREVDGRLEITELHKYPASRGRVLHHVGRFVAWSAEPLEAHLDALRGFHQQSVTSKTGSRLASLRQRKT